MLRLRVPLSVITSGVAVAGELFVIKLKYRCMRISLIHL